jgi:hypothetical protein
MIAKTGDGWRNPLPVDREERQWRAFFGLVVVLGLGWSALLAVLVVAASWWLLTH